MADETKTASASDKPSRIYLDCDGVLCDFRRQALLSFGLTPEQLTPDQDRTWEMATYLTGGDVTKFWLQIDAKY